jgi:hypothetical protein
MVVAVGFLMFALPSIGEDYWTTFFPSTVVLGIGLAISVAPLTTTVMNSAPQESAGKASGINNAVSRLAAVLSIAALGVVMLTSFDRHFSSRLDQMNVETRIRQNIESQVVRLAAIEIPPDIDDRVREGIRRSIDESFVAGFRLVMILASGLAALSSVTAWLMIEPKRKP